MIFFTAIKGVIRNMKKEAIDRVIAKIEEIEGTAPKWITAERLLFMGEQRDGYLVQTPSGRYHFTDEGRFTSHVV